MSAAQDFDQLAIRFADSLQSQGVEKSAFTEPRRFERLPTELQAQVVTRARRQVEQMELLRPDVAEHEKLSVLCNYHELTPITRDIYTQLSDHVAWEIIDFDLNQIYRSKLVFKLGHYTIEDYETNSPWELFSRPQAVFAKLAALTEMLKDANHILELDFIPPYIIEESLSKERAQFEIRHEFACPLKDKRTGETRAFISAFKVTPLAAVNRVLLM